MRGPWLAEIDLCTRVGEGVGEEGEGGQLTALPALILAYLDRFASKPVCFSDLKKYIQFIPGQLMEGFVKRLVIFVLEQYWRFRGCSHSGPRGFSYVEDA